MKADLTPKSSAKLHLSLGVPKEKIRLFPTAQDTQQEAELTAPFLNGKRFVLVTSASHMQRSINWFEQQNVEWPNAKAHSSTRLLWRTRNIIKLENRNQRFDENRAHLV